MSDVVSTFNNHSLYSSGQVRNNSEYFFNIGKGEVGCADGITEELYVVRPKLSGSQDDWELVFDHYWGSIFPGINHYLFQWGDLPGDFKIVFPKAPPFLML